MQYAFWTQKEVEFGCWLQGMKGYSNDHRFLQGVPVAFEFPDDVTFAMDPDFPDNTIVPDCPYNLDRVMLVSTRVKEFLESQNLPDVEYLQVSVIDHKGKKVKPPHFIVNPARRIAVLRLDQCEATMDSLNVVAIKKMNKFVIDEAALKDAPPMFRVEHVAEYVMVSKQLARALVNEGFTGARFIEPEKIARGKRLGHLAELPDEATAQL